MDDEKKFYILRTGEKSIGCGEYGYWETEADVLAFIDAIVRRDGIEIEFLDEREFQI